MFARFFGTASVRSRSLDQPLVPGVFKYILKGLKKSIRQESIWNHYRSLEQGPGILLYSLHRGFCFRERMWGAQAFQGQFPPPFQQYIPPPSLTEAMLD